jgi:hypothetical protein
LNQNTYSALFRDAKRSLEPEPLYFEARRRLLDAIAVVERWCEDAVTRLRLLAEAKSATPPLPPVDGEDIAILRALKESAPQLCTLYEIEAATRITRKTAGEHLDYLIDLNLACRPKGKRSGTTITPVGVTLLEKLPAPK